MPQRLRGDNPFRTKAYARAADNLLTLTVPLDQVIAEERLQNIPGVGEAIADIVKKLHATGSHPALEKMRKDIPTNVLEMLTVPGLRPDKVLKLYRELGLSSLAELEEAVRGDRLRKIKGLGASLQSKILRGIEMRRAAQGRRHMHRAAELLKVAEKHLREARPDIVRISPAGDFRRGCELVGDLSLVADVRHLPDSAQAFSMGVELTARLTDAAHFGVTLLLATGSEAHLAGLRAIAASQSMSLDDDGLRRDGKLLAAASKDSIYRALGVQPVPPELREGRNRGALHSSEAASLSRTVAKDALYSRSSSSSALPCFDREHLTLSLAGVATKMRPAMLSTQRAGSRMPRDRL